MDKLFEAGGNYPRRNFITTVLKTAGAAAAISLTGMDDVHAAPGKAKEYTVQEILDSILKEIPGAPFDKTVDTLKNGTPGQKVTGIVTTMFATIDVIRQAIKLNANFIIAHEPTFYNHADDVNWVAGNKIVQEKQELLKQHAIAVWRFHDYWHAASPDGVRFGVLKKTGWLKYSKEGEWAISIPASSLESIVEHLKTSLSISHLRIIGDRDLICKTVGIMPGAAGGQRQVANVERYNPDVLIIGETSEWETAEYFRDSIALGKKRALIVLGHSPSEEPGMEWLVDWLQPKVPGLKITHIASDSPFQWM